MLSAAAGLSAYIAAVRTDLKSDIAKVEAKLTRIEHRLLTRLDSLAILLAGLLFAAVYWPPQWGGAHGPTKASKPKRVYRNETR